MLVARPAMIRFEVLPQLSYSTCVSKQSLHSAGAPMKPAIIRITSMFFAFALLLAGPAAAVDAPNVQVLLSKPGSVRLMVSAGASGAPAGFTVDRMTQADYNALGGWATALASSRVMSSFEGRPTFNTEGTADDYRLAAGEGIEVELGQLFDETGVGATDYEELDASTGYVFRIRANNVLGGQPSPYTETMSVTSAGLAQNCTFTQGYWKNHTEAWPVAGLTLGTVNYTAAQLLAILQQPAQGNKLTILAHQLIAAKLNLNNGASPASISATIAAADALIGGLVVSPIGAGSLPTNPATGYANSLDDFNNGLIGPGHCGSVPATASTWGTVKAIYRQ